MAMLLREVVGDELKGELDGIVDALREWGAEVLGLSDEELAGGNLVIRIMIQ